MIEMFIGCVIALWLGILTSISPCPLASNIAAVSFLLRKITHPFMVFILGLVYTLGRMIAYAILGWIIISSLLSVPQVAQFLQKYMGNVLGPFLVIAGILLLGIVTIHLPRITLSQKHQNKLVESGALGAFLLGFIFVLAFCPISAALFFGSLIPLALNNQAGVLLPFIYGIGTGIPVLIFAVAIAFGVTSLSHWLPKIKKFEYCSRKITGAIFIITGLYYIKIYILKLY
ncbi:MAG: aromatic aminobenezylarsenical efflux permease ArsG family transporter [Candidatus Omnitrophica bacterium]|nr:aromatic aminobenezylarsenical efflux permease ArsG family transporter [Candidatus Omnitrophota bacterium]